MTALTVIDPHEMRQTSQSWRQSGQTVGFVPTMGALHAGHLSLVEQAKRSCDRIVVSIFVNPAQFGPGEDFAQYPRTLQHDTEQLNRIGVDAVFLPNAASMYPEGFQTYVTNRRMADGLCGASRPGHFDGVLTVVLKLFQQVQPDIAVFGKKDYQQWRVIEAMVRDLELDITVQGGDIVREEDGVAMSSRNRYLSAEDRLQAAQLYAGLQAAKAAYLTGERDASRVRQACLQVLQDAPGLQLEYCELRRSDRLEPAGDQLPDEQLVMLLAARLGSTRLIDNMELA